MYGLLQACSLQMCLAVSFCTLPFLVTYPTLVCMLVPVDLFNNSARGLVTSEYLVNRKSTTIIATTASSFRRLCRNHQPRSRIRQICPNRIGWHVISSSTIAPAADALQFIVHLRVERAQLLNRRWVGIPHSAPGCLQHALQHVAECLWDEGAQLMMHGQTVNHDPAMPELHAPRMVRAIGSITCGLALRRRAAISSSSAYVSDA